MLMKISRVRTFRVEGPAESLVGVAEERQIGHLDVYPEYDARPAGGNPPTDEHGRPRKVEHFVEVYSDDGAVGLFGPIFAPTAAIIQRHLKSHLIGKDPLAYEKLWDVLYRADRHSRKGYLMMAISALDNALWDLRGKLLGQPVYRLLGGPTRDSVPAYASMLGHSLEPERVVERARDMVARGYRAQKWFFRYGPIHGLAGMRQNAELARTVREAVGPDIDIMFDAWMGWDEAYSVRMMNRIAEYDVRWVEEPVPADRVNDLAAIRKATRVPLATGEHEYTRWGFLQLLQSEAVDVIQADPDWAGGLTELTKICALASAYGKPVCPHGHSVHAAIHLIAAQSPTVCPLAEFLVKYQPGAQFFLKGFVEPTNGVFRLPTDPGLGLALDESKIDRIVEVE
jgi:L-rhamnonate dehydratase